MKLGKIVFDEAVVLSNMRVPYSTDESIDNKKVTTNDTILSATEDLITTSREHASKDTDLEYMKDLDYKNVGMLGLFGILEETKNIIVQEGKDIKIGDLPTYENVLDTFGINNGLTFSLYKSDTFSDSIRRRSITLVDYLFESNKFYTESSYTNPLTLSSFGINSNRLLEDTDKFKLGYSQNIIESPKTDFLISDYRISDRNRNVILKAYKESVVETLARVNKPHILVCRDGSIKVLRPIHEQVATESLFSNSTEDLSWLTNALVIGLEAHNPIDFTIGHYEFINTLNSLNAEIKNTLELLIGSTKQNNLQLKSMLTELENELEVHLDSFVPDYGYAYEHSSDDNVNILYRRNNNLVLKIDAEQAQQLPFNKSNLNDYPLSVEKIPLNSISPYKATDYKFKNSILDWYDNNELYRMDDLNLYTVYGNEDKVSLFGDTVIEFDSTLNRTTQWDKFGLQSHLVGSDGKDIYYLFEEAQMCDYLIENHTNKATELYNGISSEHKVKSDVYLKKAEYESESIIYENITVVDKIKEPFVISDKFVNARNVWDIWNWHGKVSNHIMSAKSNLNIGISEYLSDFTIAKLPDSTAELPVLDWGYITEYEQRIPTWERYTNMWMGQRYFDSAFAYKYLHGLDEKKTLTMSLFRYELISTIDTVQNSYPISQTVGDDTTQEHLLTLTSDLSVSTRGDFVLNDNIFEEYANYSNNWRTSYLLKNFSKEFKKLTSSKKLPDMDTKHGLKFEDLLELQNETTQQANYFQGEMWKVTNPQIMGVKQSFTNIRKWYMNGLTNDIKLKTKSNKLSQDTHSFLFDASTLKNNTKLGINTTTNKIGNGDNARVRVHTKDIFNRFITDEIEINEDNTNEFLAKMIGIDESVFEITQRAIVDGNKGFEQVQNPTFGLGLGEEFTKEFPTQSKDKRTVECRQRILDSNLGYLALHTLAPMIISVGENLADTLTDYEAIRQIFGDLSIEDVENGKGVANFVYEEYQRLFTMNEYIKSHWVSPNLISNMFPRLKGKYDLISYNSMTDRVSTAYNASISDGGEYEMDIHNMMNTIMFNEDPLPLLQELQYYLNRLSSNSVNKDGSTVGFHTQTQPHAHSDSELDFYQGYQGAYTRLFYDFTKLGGDNKFNNASIRNAYQVYETQGSFLETMSEFRSSMVTNMIPFRPTYDPKTYRVAQELNLGKVRDIVYSAPFKAFYGITKDLVLQDDLTIGVVPIHRPIYINKMPDDYCINETIRDAMYDLMSNLNATTELSNGDTPFPLNNAIPSVVVDKFVTRAFAMSMDYFREFVNDFTFEMKSLKSRLNKGLFGDQVLRGRKISDFNTDENAVETFLDLLERHYHVRLTQEHSQDFTLSEAFKGYENKVYKSSETSDKQADIAYYIQKMFVMYETILELKNSAYHIDLSQSKAIVNQIGNENEDEKEFVYLNNSFSENILPSNWVYNNGSIEASNVSVSLNVKCPLTNKGNFKSYASHYEMYNPNDSLDNLNYTTDEFLFPYYYRVGATSWDRLSPVSNDLNPIDDVKLSNFRAIFDDVKTNEKNSKFIIAPLNMSDYDTYELVDETQSKSYEYYAEGASMGGYEDATTSITYNKNIISYISKWSNDVNSKPNETYCKYVAWYEKDNVDRYDLTTPRRPFIFQGLSDTRIPFGVDKLSIENKSNEHKYYLDGCEGKLVEKLGLVSSLYTEESSIFVGYTTLEMLFVDVSLEADKSKLITNHTEQIGYWTKKKDDVLKAIKRYDEDKTQLVTMLEGGKDYYRGHRAFVPPTKNQVESLKFVIENINCEIPNLQFVGNPYKLSDLKPLFAKTNQSVIITTNQLFADGVDFNPTWNEFFKDFGYDLNTSYSETTENNVHQHHRQAQALLTDIEGVLDSKIEYKPYFGKYTEYCNTQSFNTSKFDTDIFDETTTKDADCETISTSKMVERDSSSKTIDWMEIFKKDEVKFMKSDYRHGDEFKYKDIVNIDGRIIASADMNIKSAILKNE